MVFKTKLLLNQNNTIFENYINLILTCSGKKKVPPQYIIFCKVKNPKYKKDRFFYLIKFRFCHFAQRVRLVTATGERCIRIENQNHRNENRQKVSLVSTDAL